MTINMFALLCNDHCLIPEQVIFDLPWVNWKQITYKEADKLLSEMF